MNDKYNDYGYRRSIHKPRKARVVQDERSLGELADSVERSAARLAGLVDRTVRGDSRTRAALLRIERELGRLNEENDE